MGLRWALLSIVALVLVGCRRHHEPSHELCDDGNPCMPHTGTDLALIRGLALNDPLQHLFTLNSHGTYSEETFVLPAAAYVLVPHPMGFEVPYMLNSPSNHISFEEMLYRQPSGLMA
jgi:hypothetical protein